MCPKMGHYFSFQSHLNLTTQIFINPRLFVAKLLTVSRLVKHGLISRRIVKYHCFITYRDKVFEKLKTVLSAFDNSFILCLLAIFPTHFIMLYIFCGIN